MRKVFSAAIIFLLLFSWLSVFLFFPKFTAEAKPDTETLRPNGAGSETSLYIQQSGTGEHWDKVDEETADDNSTFVYLFAQSAGGNWRRDLYALPAHTGSGTINSVTVYARFRDGYGSNSSGKISIKTNGTAYNTSAYALTTSWATKSNVWTNNPQTGLAWTWDEIDALEAGISLYELYYYEESPPSIIKGQPVLMADGNQKSIEDVIVGDEVISFNLDSQKIEKDKVIKIMQGSHDDYLVFNGVLKTSLDHLIWASGRFKPAKEIKVGDFLLDSGGNKISVTEIEYIQEKVETYDLIIEKNHNFFASNYLVHNISASGYCTQVYVVVDYTSGPGMTSTSYKIISSDINAGGRDDQTSTTYKMQDTIGGIATGISESALYKLMAGYRTLDDLSISFSISDLAIGFGTFSSTNSRWATSNETGGTSEPANQNPSYITISTNAPYGAIVSARSKGSGTGVEGNGSAGLYKSPTLIAATACTTVVNGTESYALYVKNVGSNLTAASGFNGGTCTGIISTTNQTILTASVPLSTNNTADVALKAAIASTTLASSSYADVITLTGTGKF